MFMKFFTFLGGISSIMLYFFTGENIELGIIFAALASIGFAGSMVFTMHIFQLLVLPTNMILLVRGIFRWDMQAVFCW